MSAAPLPRVYNAAGRAFNVRAVAYGDCYGLNDCLVNDKEPMIEFYDATYTEGFGPRGQFASRYYLSTLQDSGEHCGLQLDGGVPEWCLTAGNVLDACNYASQEVQS